MSIHKIGILTAGGDCPGLNAVVRAVSKNALGHGIEVLGFKNGFDGLVRNEFINITDETVSNILTQGGTILGSSNIANPFKYTLPPFGTPQDPKDLSSVVMHNFKENQLDALITVGGDGTLHMSQQFVDLGMPIVAVPKTIDNDLCSTDQTFGFDSALAIATEAIDRLHTTAQSHHRVMIVETMGRYAGWIALRSAIAGGGDIVLVPEIPYNDEVIVNHILERRRKGKTFSIVVAAEGAKNEAGEQAVTRTVAGSTDPIRLGGIAYKLSQMIEDKTGIESRACVLGHTQRGGTPTAFDRWLSTLYGAKAMDMILEGKFGYMASLHAFKMEEVKIADAIAQLKRVDPQGPEVKAALEVGMSFGSTQIG
ncbi:6-phosphofructokinase [Candidatus Avelusimicrobium faecicola]|uniref:6-phosphofructokinase n=1 Tax=Candidatus Avelusimicrobium faecicola TaxID=3416205 RepID=UPI002A5F8F6F|nr:ATP-dependent 6-phosphofructokinase [Spirochaetota bacterium]MCI7536528.1 ATP-dependent 6-phosphofructokinase [Spirochaetota bacterium]MDE3277533.1 ATP-dependent 6-phosphofructokinase [Spirochaetota bacterium]MDY2940342.1 ATP-dependent 6-phosphofructokinase [Elusimicrobiaceae bacterium]MDY6128857.1 ATP-dependent 6-phosphofructokinase [Elusimicrobiaceae bacterium]